MKTKIPTAVITISAAILVFTGCGENSTPETAPTTNEQTEQAPEPQPTAESPAEANTADFSSNRYAVTSQYGGEIEFDVPADLNHPLVAPIEEYREEIGIPGAVYIIAEVDNRQGTMEVKLPEISIFDHDGMEYPFIVAEWAIDSWSPWDDGNAYYDAYGNVIDEATYETQTDQADALTETQPFDVPYGAVGELVLILEADEFPEQDQIASVATWPHGIEGRVDAHPIQGN